ncbi:Leucine-rich repeat-containing protein 15 [Trichoplax sp. H2]|nr:Leucine-rich repeat-containing protein 15 [Trichoplax sp. H2]|eukprot:RDD36973.1 Leucine-rich repeat-containing protein 15 [Trichoplax sp. H2]
MTPALLQKYTIERLIYEMAPIMLCLIFLSVCPLLAFSQCPVQCQCTGNPVTTVTCTGSQITSLPIPTQNYDKVNKFILANTAVTTLPVNSFSKFPNLLHLYLSNNLISDIKVGAFNNLSALSSLDLSSNKIQTLPNLVFNSLYYLSEL